MNDRIAAGLGVAVLVVGCSSGAGPVAGPSPSTRDEPGAGRDVPPDGRDTPGSACVACEVVYACAGGAFGGGQLALTASAGTCQPHLVDLVCSGVLFGATGCTGGGGAAFTCGGTTCTPAGNPGYVMVVTQPGIPSGTSGLPGIATDGG